MRLVKALLIALSMYSKIPVPQVTWTDDNMKYAMCFFPLIGAVIGTFIYVLGNWLSGCSYGTLFKAAVMTLIPIIISGGIHMDGFIDTVDALSSYSDREKKLAILSDPHAGAFAILWVCCYFVLSLGLWSEVANEMLPVLGLGFVLSRALSGLAVVAFPAAKESGLAKTFQAAADRKRTGIVMLGYVVLSAAGILLLSRFSGIVVLGGAVAVFVYYRLILVRQFQGVTGDLAGYFLQLCELTILAAVVLAGGAL